MLVQPSSAVTNMEITSRGKKLTFAHGFKKFSPLVTDSIVNPLYLLTLLSLISVAHTCLGAGHPLEQRLFSLMAILINGRKSDIYFAHICQFIATALRRH